jgi:hypothetical protein
MSLVLLSYSLYSRASRFSTPCPSIVTPVAGPAVPVPLPGWPGSRHESAAVQQLRGVSGVNCKDQADVPTVIVGLCPHQAFKELVELSFQEQSFTVGSLQKNEGTLGLGL